MGLACPECGRDYDVTLFEFGRNVQCVCGAVVTLESGHLRRARGKSERDNKKPEDSITDKYDAPDDKAG